jgi:hypothetical protein
MPMKIVSGLFDNYEDAKRAVSDIEAAGVSKDEISIVANNTDLRYTYGGEAGHSRAAAGAGAGAAFGGVVGGGAGLLAGLGMLAIPGVGPVVAAGWLVAAAAGVAAGAAIGGATGGIIGAMVREGVPEEHAHVYAEGVRRGGTLVSVRAHDTQVEPVEGIMAEYNAVDADARGALYREAGWERFDEEAPPISEAEIDAERDRLRNRPPV